MSNKKEYEFKGASSL